ECGLYPAMVGQVHQPFAESAVAYLIVVLQEQDERGGGKVAAGLTAALPPAVDLTLIDEALLQAAGQLDGGLPGKIPIVAFVFPGQQDMQGMMTVVVPLGVIAGLQQTGLVA